MANSYGSTIGVFSGSLTSLANAQVVLLGEIDLGAVPPHEVLIEAWAKASGTPSGNKQLALYVASSFDGSQWSDAPDATTTLNSRLAGTLALPDTAKRQTAALPLSPLFGGALPRYLRVYARNELGVALSSTPADNGGRWVTENFA